MQEFFHTIIHHTFMQYALLAGFLSSLAVGITGSFVVIRRISYLAGGLAHATLGGMGMAYYFGYNPLMGGAIFAVIAAMCMSWVRFHFNQNEDTLISALWSIGMAMGILFLYKTPGYSADLHSFLFGNILMISKQSLYILLALNGILLLFFFVFYRQFISICFDEDFAYLKGLPVGFLYTLLLCLVALTIVILVSCVGLILVIALLTLPASSLKAYTSNPGKLMAGTFLLAMICVVGGLYVSYLYDTPSGPFIIFFCGGFYFLFILINKRLRF